MHNICTRSICSKHRIQIFSLCRTNPISDVPWCSFVARSSCRTSLTRLTATPFFEGARKNAQHSCVSARSTSWRIMPSLLHSKLGTGHVCLQDCLVTDKPARYREWHLDLLQGNLSSQSAPPAAVAASTPCPCCGQKHWCLQSEDIFTRDNGGHGYDWLREGNRVQVPGAFVSWGTNFQRDKRINPQIAQLHIFMYTLSTYCPQLQGCVLTSGQVQTISNLACWRVHLRLLQEETWFHDLSPEDARSWADAGGVANLSEVVSGKKWMRGDLYIDSDSSPWAQPLCCPLSFFIPGFSCASLQISSIEISYLLLFGSLNLSFVPDARNTWLVSTQAVRWIILLPPFGAGSHSYGFVRNFGISENFFVEIHKFASCTRFVFIVVSCWMSLVPFKQTMSWLFCPRFTRTPCVDRITDKALGSVALSLMLTQRILENIAGSTKCWNPKGYYRFLFQFAIEMSKGASHGLTRSDRIFPTMFCSFTSTFIRCWIIPSFNVSGHFSLMTEKLGARWLSPFLLADSETNLSISSLYFLFCSFLFVKPMFGQLGSPRPPALSQEWCKGVGVIADETGVAVKAIKARLKELMGWWLGWGFEHQ